MNDKEEYIYHSKKKVETMNNTINENKMTDTTTTTTTTNGNNKTTIPRPNSSTKKNIDKDKKNIDHDKDKNNTNSSSKSSSSGIKLNTHLSKKKKRSSSRRSKKEKKRRRSSTPSSPSELRVRSSSNGSKSDYFAIEITKPGGYEELKLVKKNGKGGSGPNLEMMKIPKEDLVVVSTDYAGVNYADVCIRWGLYTSAKEFVGWPIVSFIKKHFFFFFFSSTK